MILRALLFLALLLPLAACPPPADDDDAVDDDDSSPNDDDAVDDDDSAPDDDDVAPDDDDSAPGDDDVAPDDDDATPDPAFQVVIGAPPLVRLTDGTVDVPVTCSVWQDGALLEGIPVTLATSSPGASLDAAGLLTLTQVDTAEITCTHDATGAATTAAVSAASAAPDSGWLEAGDATAAAGQVLAQVAQLPAGDPSIDAEAAALFEQLAGHVDAILAQALREDPVVPAIPGGYPDEATLTANGLGPGPDDEAFQAAVTAVGLALDAYTAAVEAVDLDTDDPTQFVPVEAAIADVEVAIEAALVLDPSEALALSMRQEMADHLSEHVIPALAVVPQRVAVVGAEQVASRFLLGLVISTGLQGTIHGALINAWYGPAISWIDASVDTMLTLELIDLAWAPDPGGPEIWSINYGNNVFFEGDAITIHGEGFSNTADLNQVLFIADGILTSALGVFDACLGDLPDDPENFFAAANYFEGCVDAVMEVYEWGPDATSGYGDVLIDHAGGFYGPQTFDVGTPDVQHSGGGFPDLVGVIPVNLSNGLRGESYNVLLYP